jgi:hypothetical protein
MTQAAALAQYGSTGVSQGFKNRIINGQMAIDQRNAGASITPANGDYTLDRWVYQAYQAGKVTCQQNAGSVTPPVGFSNYLGFTSTSAYTVGSGEAFWFSQRIEGFNTADLGWGSASAKTVTLSFQVRSSLTGTFGGFLSNSASDRSYPFSYTISSANTWTSISVTIAGDTTGTWLTTNGTGIRVGFSLGAGSTFSTTAGSWAAGQYFSATGATSVVGVSGATFYLTGVQLEVGSTATSFDYRPYGTELALCQRYFERTNTNDIMIWTGDVTNTQNYYLTGLFMVQKRATPTFTATIGSTSGFGTTVADSGGNTNCWDFAATCNSTGARRYFTGGFTASAEL